MYIVGAHMDGHGWGEAANDDGSGTALVMELAAHILLSGRQDRTVDPVRALGTTRDGGLNGAYAYCGGACGTAGPEDPAGSASTPEPGGWA